MLRNDLGGVVSLLNQGKLQNGCLSSLSRDHGGRLAGGCVLLVLGVCHFALSLCGQALPFADGERLVYEVTWPSGLSLGEAEFQARATKQGWSFETEISANLPTMEIRDEYHSSAGPDLCSIKLEKKARHGSQKTHESVVFDQENHTAERKTMGGGGESEIKITPCTRDGLAFLYALRQELALGRIPPPDDINFGAQYQVSVTYAEAIEIDTGGSRGTADRVLIDLTGPASKRSFEIFFGRDAARTPLLMRVPFELGTFSLKLLK